MSVISARGRQRLVSTLGSLDSYLTLLVTSWSKEDPVSKEKDLFLRMALDFVLCLSYEPAHRYLHVNTFAHTHLNN